VSDREQISVHAPLENFRRALEHFYRIPRASISSRAKAISRTNTNRARPYTESPC